MSSNFFGGTFTARPGAGESGTLGHVASANIHGGVFSSVDDDRPFEIDALNNSTVNFFGSGFETAELYPGAFRLTGILSDGSPLDVLASGNFVLHEIPEPSGIWLAALAFLLVSMARKRETAMRETSLHSRLIEDR